MLKDVFLKMVTNIIRLSTSHAQAAQYISNFVKKHDPCYFALKFGDKKNCFSRSLYITQNVTLQDYDLKRSSSSVKATVVGHLPINTQVKFY